MLETLRQQIVDIIHQECSDQIQREAILHAMTRPGFALHHDASCRAGVLTLEIYKTIAGAPCDAAVVGAAGVELLIESSFMLDHVGDQEIDPQYGLGYADELALAIALLNIGIAATYEAEQRENRSFCKSSLLRPLLTDIVRACAGQFLDSRFKRHDPVTTEDALNMTSLKAGSLGRMTAGYGAGLATDDQGMITLFSEFGFNLFTYFQLIDDLRDACPAQGQHSDLSQNKKTVPLVFFYNLLADRHCEGRSGTMPPQAAMEAAGLDIRREYETSGAQAFGAIIAETFLNRAKRNLAELRDHLETVQTLEHLLTTVEITSQELVRVS